MKWRSTAIKQVVQNLRSGVLELLEVPCPKVGSGHLLIQSRASLISAGTERSLVEFGRANLLSKARQNPDRVKQVLDKIKSDGILPTLEAVFSRLDEPLPLGYCNAGVVREVGSNVTNYAVGDRVASNGPHAQWVNVPENLCAKVPDNVSDEAASFAVIGSIALQGIRLLRPAIGEYVVVYGLGLVGQLTVQLLGSTGARVLGLDLDANRLALAAEYGATSVELGSGADPLRAAESFSRGRGVDGVLITASAKNDEIVNQSARMCRKRGRIIMVGVTNMELNRAEFYEKELTFQVSCSYGPGRYDASYEQEGNDYPYAFVRWTEQRNIQAILDLMSAGQLDVSRLITKRIDHEQAPDAYDALASDRTQMAIILNYPARDDQPNRVAIGSSQTKAVRGSKHAVAGIIGAGMFTKGVLLPCLVKTGIRLKSIASAGGLSAAHACRKFGIENSTSEHRAILDDPEINVVFITTRHHQHAAMVVEALQAGKHVFVEKPLAIDRDGLAQVQQAYDKSDGQLLMVGFNRRFSPLAGQIERLLGGRTQPLCMIMTVNAGHIPIDHWVHDPKTGGGRIIGEGCHWLDLFRYLSASPIEEVQATAAGAVSGVLNRNDHATISIGFQDGSIGTLHYYANGHRTFPKESLTIFSEGRVLELDNFRVLRGYGFSGFRRKKLTRQDKGHKAELMQWAGLIGRGGGPLISPVELWEVTKAAIEANEACYAS